MAVARIAASEFGARERRIGRRKERMGRELMGNWDLVREEMEKRRGVSEFLVERFDFDWSLGSFVRRPASTISTLFLKNRVLELES